MSETYDDVITRLIAGRPHSDAGSLPSLNQETSESVQGLRQPLAVVAEVVFGSMDRVDEAVSWLIETLAVALSFNKEDTNSPGFLEILDNLHRVGDDDITRYLFALGALGGLIDIDGYEELRPHFDVLHEALNRRIDGGTELLERGDDALPSTQGA
jgi:hypothetical protein